LYLADPYTKASTKHTFNLLNLPNSPKKPHAYFALVSPDYFTIKSQVAEKPFCQVSQKPKRLNLRSLPADLTKVCMEALLHN
jgi:hypothetical protein